MQSAPTVQQLFKRWRSERDATAGQQMAQKFSDWYYAITAARLGDRTGREPLEAACQAFEQGIVQVKRTSELVDWAHEIVAKEIERAGGRVGGGDFPNALTQKRSPTELLVAARSALPAHQVEVLALAFDPSVDAATLEARAEPYGGVPDAILEARYALKRYLRDSAGVELEVVPDQPNLDLAPLPLYEAARMTEGSEEAAFEKWLLSDIELCKDVAEFAAFAHALRAGAFRGNAAAAPLRTVQPAMASADAHHQPAPTADAPAAKSGGGKGLFIGIGVFLFLAAAAVVAVFVLS